MGHKRPAQTHIAVAGSRQCANQKQEKCKVLISMIYELRWFRSPWAPLRPQVSHMHPRCLPEASQMPPRCLPDAPQMPARCLQDASPAAKASEQQQQQQQQQQHPLQNSSSRSNSNSNSTSHSSSNCNNRNGNINSRLSQMISTR